MMDEMDPVDLIPPLPHFSYHLVLLLVVAFCINLLLSWVDLPNLPSILLKPKYGVYFHARTGIVFVKVKYQTKTYLWVQQQNYSYHHNTYENVQDAWMMIPKKTFRDLDENLKKNLMGNVPLFRILREGYEEDLENEQVEQEENITPT